MGGKNKQQREVGFQEHIVMIPKIWGGICIMQKCLLGYDVGYRYYRFILPSSFMEPAVVPSVLQAQETAPAVSSLLLVRLLLCESVRTDV